jgi:hypothetical protein
LTLVSILEVEARVDSFLDALASCIQSEALVHVHGRVHAEVVSTCDQHCAGLVRCVRELFLALRQLRVGSRGINDLGQFDVWLPDEALSLSLKP